LPPDHDANIESQKEYKTVIQQELADSASGVMRRPNNVSHYQRIFQKNDGNPVFLKTKADASLYRNMMRLSAIGLGVCAISIGMLATGQFKK